MLAQLFVITFIVFFVYYYLFVRKPLKLPPGPIGVPLLGHIFAVSGRPYITFTKWQREFGKIFTCKFGGIRIIVLGDSKMVKECFNEPVFSGRSGRMMLCLLSKGKRGIVSSDGPEWVEQRRFTLRHLRDFGFGKNSMEASIMEEVDDFIQLLKREEGSSFDMHERFELPVLSALWLILAGKKLSHDDADALDMLRKIDVTFTKPSVTGIINLLAPSLLNLFPNLLGLNHCLRIADSFHEMLGDIIKEHQNTLPDEGNARDFIDAYLHEINRTNDDNSSFYKETGILSLIAIAGDMFFAGSETTSVTLTWAMLYLAVNPEVQEKLQEEIDRVVGHSRAVSLSDRPKMPYGEATTIEIFRKSSIVVTGVMHTPMRDAKFMGYDIPKDAWIMPNIYAIHHDPEIWGDPDQFRPERFLSPDGKTVQRSENMLAFSLGKRQCIGENLARDQVWLFVMNIFRRFTVSWDPSRPKPDISMSKEGFILKPEDFHVVIKDRLA